MDAEFWKNRWTKNELGWHEGRANTMLAKHWPALGLSKGSLVFVPLCGKSADMTWLAAQGHRVLGVELSEIAVAAFFAENGLEPRRESRDGFDVSSAGGIEIWCGDLFKLEPRHLAGIAGAYDRASLYAMPPAMQPRYAAHLTQVLARGASILLVTFDTGEVERKGPPFSTSPEQVRALFDKDFEIADIERSQTDKLGAALRARGVTQVTESVLLLRRL
jgi:thiopurine S-methyltransferase